MNQGITSTIDLGLSALGGFAYAKLGLRPVLIIAFVASVLGGLLIIFLGDDFPKAVPFMLTLAKGGVKVSLDVCYFANSSIFPAIFAGTAFGFCNSGAKIATILSPMLAETEHPLPMVLVVIMSSLSAALAWFIISEEAALKKVTSRKRHEKSILDDGDQ